MRNVFCLVMLMAFFTGSIFSQDATGWPHKNAAGQTVRHVIVMNHLDKSFTLTMSGYANRTMNPGDSFVIEHSFGWASARCAGYYPGTTNMGALSLAEWTMGANNNDDWYDVSLVDGYNLPVRMFPVKGTFTATTTPYMCDTVGCTKDLLPNCPPELQVKSAAGTLVQCLSACSKFSTDAYCCRGAYGSGPQACPPTSYSKLFKDACPWAYSYAYDDIASLDQCVYSGGIGPDFVIEFGYFQDKAAVSWKPSLTVSSIGSDAITKTKDNVLRYTITGRHSSHVWLGLYSCSGKLVAQSEVIGATGAMSLTGVSKGAYVAVLKSGRELLVQKTVAVK